MELNSVTLVYNQSDSLCFKKIPAQIELWAFLLLPAVLYTGTHVLATKASTGTSSPNAIVSFDVDVFEQQQPC